MRITGMKATPVNIPLEAPMWWTGGLYPGTSKVIVEILTDQGLVGLGEARGEVLQVMDDMRSATVDFLTIGQYLRPTTDHLPIERYYHPDEFAEMREEAMALGFRHVESGLVGGLGLE